MGESHDKEGAKVIVGDVIEVLEIDARLTEYLDEEDIASLLVIVGMRLEVKSINSDGSMVVTHMNRYGDIVGGHDVAIFPKGAKIVRRP